jgi:hypothetical protein
MHKHSSENYYLRARVQNQNKAYLKLVKSQICKSIRKMVLKQLAREKGAFYGIYIQKE